MGAVYKARQIHLDRLVAVKLLAPRHAADPGFDERFAREARALARLEHPSIVAVHDFGRVLDRSYLVMQHIDGSNLRQVIATGTLSGTEVLRLVRQLCDALEHAHAAGVVHRDLKPENILIDGRGNAHVADFGLAKLSEGGQELTGTGEVLGTLHYMAPEPAGCGFGSVDHRADLYVLGVIIYEMLTGSLPLGAASRLSVRRQRGGDQRGRGGAQEPGAQSDAALRQRQRNAHGSRGRERPSSRQGRRARGRRPRGHRHKVQAGRIDRQRGGRGGRRGARSGRGG